MAFWFYVIVIAVLMLIALVTENGLKGVVGRQYAVALGAISLFLSLLQFIPQIFQTWRLKRIGALSTPTMCMQIPGIYLCKRNETPFYRVYLILRI